MHKSELKAINTFTGGQEGSINCKACNSFAQWGIDNLGENFLDKYWDYEKNVLNPWKLDNNSTNKIYIKCIDKIYHESYLVSCNSFVGSNSRCPYCNSQGGRVHILDSLGTLHSKSILVWSNKNKKSSFEYTPMSHQEVWWKCENSLHNDYKRSIKSSNICSFRCPECQHSEGEYAISQHLMMAKIKYVPQKSFKKFKRFGGWTTYIRFLFARIQFTYRISRRTA